jgi:hypothetical protein
MGPHPPKDSMKMASSENVIPQEGTDRSAIGESLAGPSGLVSPTVSGGGKNRLRDVSPRPCSREEDSNSDSDKESVLESTEEKTSKKDKDGIDWEKISDEEEETTEVVRQLRNRAVVAFPESNKRNPATTERKRPHSKFFSDMDSGSETEIELSAAAKIHSTKREQRN